jgi:hypothetical protein
MTYKKKKNYITKYHQFQELDFRTQSPGTTTPPPPLPQIPYNVCKY